MCDVISNFCMFPHTSAYGHMCESVCACVCVGACVHAFYCSNLTVLVRDNNEKKRVYCPWLPYIT